MKDDRHLVEREHPELNDRAELLGNADIHGGSTSQHLLQRFAEWLAVRAEPRRRANGDSRRFGSRD
jgi:hypothetical protein